MKTSVAFLPHSMSKKILGQTAFDKNYLFYFFLLIDREFNPYKFENLSLSIANIRNQNLPEKVQDETVAGMENS